MFARFSFISFSTGTLIMLYQKRSIESLKPLYNNTEYFSFSGLIANLQWLLTQTWKYLIVENDVLTLDCNDNFEPNVHEVAYNSNNGHKQSAEPGRES